MPDDNDPVETEVQEVSFPLLLEVFKQQFEHLQAASADYMAIRAAVDRGPAAFNDGTLGLTLSLPGLGHKMISAPLLTFPCELLTEVLELMANHAFASMHTATTELHRASTVAFNTLEQARTTAAGVAPTPPPPVRVPPPPPPPGPMRPKPRPAVQQAPQARQPAAPPYRAPVLRDPMADASAELERLAGDEEVVPEPVEDPDPL